MPTRPRLYDTLRRDHLARHRQMALVSGPREVGKTTTGRAVADVYLNWDNLDDRRKLLAGPTSVATAIGLEQLRAKPPVAVFDERHKYPKWKGRLKGLFDTNPNGRPGTSSRQWRQPSPRRAPIPPWGEGHPRCG